MRRIKAVFQAGSAAIVAAGLLAVGLPAGARADTAHAPSLVISQLKITSSNGQFITLYNSTNSMLDMSKYQLEYFNSYDLGKATSSKLVSLSGLVPPHGYFMVNDSSLLLCYQLTVDSVSLGLSSTVGLVEVVGFNQASPGGSVTPGLEDYVGWSKTATAGAQTLPAGISAFLQRQPVDAGNNPAVASPGAGSWQTAQPDANNACSLVGANGTTTIQTGLGQLLPSAEPAAMIVALNGDDDSGAAALTAIMPAADIGLMAPTLTELLPNPAGTGNDATDEFIEVYNPNDTAFDLTGFGLQVGTTALHSFTFPANTTLAPHGFTAFYSSATGLSLSNSGGQSKLLDPFGNSIAATAVYGPAKDGVAWALANGKWYWTTKLTPGAANVINQPPAGKKTAAKAKSSKAAAKTKTPKKAKIKTAASSQYGTDDPATTTPIHAWTLALVAGLALLYGAYEYRTDLANRIYRLRRYFAARRSGGA
jgi:hypothetical protein